jgi:6-phosphogluconolactonase
MAGNGENSKGVPRIILPGVRVYPNADEVARGAARFFVEYAWQAIARDDRFLVALSGGKTPQALFRILSSPEFRGQVDWGKVQVFWSDERAVPPTDPESNYGMARRELLLKVAIPEANVHRMEAEGLPIGRAAHDYEELLRMHLELDENGFPQFHLVFLGMGADGHTASLFPGARATQRTSRWVSTPMVPKLGAFRMSLTLPVLNAAKRVLFLVVGADKAKTLRAVLDGKAQPPYPAQLVDPPHGSRNFLIDEAAASLLEQDETPPGPQTPEKSPSGSKKKIGR